MSLPGCSPGDASLARSSPLLLFSVTILRRGARFSAALVRRGAAPTFGPTPPRAPAGLALPFKGLTFVSILPLASQGKQRFTLGPAPRRPATRALAHSAVDRRAGSQQAAVLAG